MRRRIQFAWWTIAAMFCASAGVPAPPAFAQAVSYATVDALPGVKLQDPLCIANPPGEKDRLFIIEKTGKIDVITGFGGPQPRAQVFLDIPRMLQTKNEGRLSTDNETGVLGIAFHPDYAKNGFFYVTYSLNSNGKLYDRLARFRVSASDPNVADPQSEQPMITQLDLAVNHNGGDLHFGADGYLYYSMGDEGGQGDQFNNARFVDKDFYAALFRLDVDQKPGNLPPNLHYQDSTEFPSAVSPNTYKVPKDNPFINATEHNGKPLDPKKIRTEIWATGFRNPWRFYIDPPTQRVFVGNVGDSAWESIDLVSPGDNIGWSYMEGTHHGPRFRQAPADFKWNPPIYEYHHDQSEFGGNCIIGGVVYHGTSMPELDGAYIFGDNGAKHIWALSQNGDKWTPSTLISRDNSMAAFGIDPHNGDVLIAAFGSGKIERLVHAPAP